MLQETTEFRRVINRYGADINYKLYLREIDELAKKKYAVQDFSALLTWDGERYHTNVYSLSGVLCWLRNSLQHSASKRRWVTNFADDPVLVNESLFELAMDANCKTFHKIIDSIVEFLCDSP